jgi:rhamnose transport system ATP-binding protein
MGENGAGKSTFIKVITGVFPPEEGQIFLDGKEVSFKSTRDSLARGIAAVYQHPTTYPDLSVTENIFMGHQIKKGPIMDWKAMHRKAAELLGRAHRTVLDVIGPQVGGLSTIGALSNAGQAVPRNAVAINAGGGVQNVQYAVVDTGFKQALASGIPSNSGRHINIPPQINNPALPIKPEGIMI